jgi:hypothetical protein
VEKMGIRSIVTNQNAVNSIHYKDTPEVLFIVSPKENASNSDTKMNYIPIQI